MSQITVKRRGILYSEPPIDGTLPTIGVRVIGLTMLNCSLESHRLRGNRVSVTTFLSPFVPPEPMVISTTICFPKPYRIHESVGSIRVIDSEITSFPDSPFCVQEAMVYFQLDQSNLVGLVARPYSEGMVGCGCCD